MNKFKELGLTKGMLETIEHLNFKEPTEIQEKAIPLVMEGRDVIGQSATGSGKTLAFGSGVIEKTHKKQGIQALVLTPTRELANQVSDSLKRFSKNYELNVVEIYGGVPIDPQIRRLQKAEIVVGTPGRIMDHLNRRTLDLRKVCFLILDEADRMVDMGFLPDVEKIISLCPKARQTLLFSATISQDINYIERKYMNHPAKVSAKSYVDPSKLKQIFYDVPAYEKFSLLAYLLKKERSGMVMVFCNTRRNVEILSINLGRFGIHAVEIHGGMTQNKRNQSLQGFHKNEVGVLICTDVAARGLDIRNVSHIYNYDIPKDSTDYIHRIGRTARAGKEGEAISLVSAVDYENFRRVLLDDSLNIKQNPLPEFEKLKPKFSEDSNRGRERRGYSQGQRRDSRQGGYSRSSRRDSQRGGYSGGPRRDSRPGQRRAAQRGGRSGSPRGERSSQGQRRGSRPGSRPHQRGGNRRY